MQSRKHSLIESCCNVGSGFLLSMLIWEVVVEPLFGIEKKLIDNIGITLIFTIASLIRGYAWRRIFNGK